MNAPDEILQRKIGLVGFLDQTACRDGVLDPSVFLHDNGRRIAELYPMIRSTDIHIGFFDDSTAEELLIGTSAHPLVTETGPAIPAKQMVVLFNGARLVGLRSRESDMAMAMLWRQIFKGNRLWFVRHEQMQEHMLIQSDVLAKNGYPSLVQIMKDHASRVGWTPRRIAEEFDAAAVAHYLADLMHHRYMDSREVSLSEIYSALFLANSFNHVERMPEM